MTASGVASSLSRQEGSRSNRPPALVIPCDLRASNIKRSPAMLAKYSIRAKVIAVVAFLLAAIQRAWGGLAAWNMRSINANTVDIATNWLPSVHVLGELHARRPRLSQRRPRAHAVRYALGQGSRGKKTLATVVESNNKIRQAYETAGHVAGKRRALYVEWSQLWDQYKEKSSMTCWVLSRKAVGQISP